MALAHKSIACELVPWRITEKDRIAASGGITAPVLFDTGHWIRDSWAIADYLDKTFPDRPLLASDSGGAKAAFVDAWVTRRVHPLMARAVLLEQLPMLTGDDQAFYRKRTVEKYGTTIEQLCADPDGAAAALPEILSPLDVALCKSDFLGGAAPDYADYIVFGAFQWVRVVSSRQFIEPDSSIDRWFDRLLDAFDGLGRAQPDRNYWAEQKR